MQQLHFGRRVLTCVTAALLVVLFFVFLNCHRCFIPRVLKHLRGMAADCSLYNGDRGALRLRPLSPLSCERTLVSDQRRWFENHRWLDLNFYLNYQTAFPATCLSEIGSSFSFCVSVATDEATSFARGPAGQHPNPGVAPTMRGDHIDSLIPPNWGKEDLYDPWTRVQLPPTDPEYKEVVKQLKLTAGKSVTEIIKVNGVNMYQNYVRRRNVELRFTNSLLCVWSASCFIAVCTFQWMKR